MRQERPELNTPNSTLTTIMDGAEILLESLKREGGDTLFGISGGAI